MANETPWLLNRLLNETLEERKARVLARIAGLAIVAGPSSPSSSAAQPTLHAHEWLVHDGGAQWKLRAEAIAAISIGVPSWSDLQPLMINCISLDNRRATFKLSAPEGVIPACVVLQVQTSLVVRELDIWYCVNW